jgi:hypothetical protein
MAVDVVSYEHLKGYARPWGYAPPPAGRTVPKAAVDEQNAFAASKDQGPVVWLALLLAVAMALAAYWWLR